MSRHKATSPFGQVTVSSPSPMQRMPAESFAPVRSSFLISHCPLKTSILVRRQSLRGHHWEPHGEASASAPVYMLLPGCQAELPSSSVAQADAAHESGYALVFAFKLGTQVPVLRHGRERGHSQFRPFRCLHPCVFCDARRSSQPLSSSSARLPSCLGGPNPGWLTPGRAPMACTMCIKRV